MELEKLIRDIPDFPKPGILFKDLTTLWKDKHAFKQHIDSMAALFADMYIEKVVGTESRGFIIGAPLAYALGAGFVPVRKAGKLPGDTISRSYALEYGQASIEMHTGAIEQGENVLFVDDLLATGGTSAASIDLIREQGGNVVAAAYIVELSFLKGKDKIDAPVYSLIQVKK